MLSVIVNETSQAGDNSFSTTSFFLSEYANKKKLQQDHPCVLHLIRKKYIRQPAPVDLPYHLNNPRLVDPSDGQSKGILALLRNQV